MLTRDIPVDEMILYQPRSLNDRSRKLPFQLPGAGADGPCPLWYLTMPPRKRKAPSIPEDDGE